MQLVNLTHRTINIMDDGGTHQLLELPPDDTVVNVSIKFRVLDTVKDEDCEEPIDIVTYEYSNVTGLPEPEKDTMYVVSFAVLQALAGKRKDVVAPDTSPSSIVRDPQNGRIIGVRRLRRL